MADSRHFYSGLTESGDARKRRLSPPNVIEEDESSPTSNDAEKPYECRFCPMKFSKSQALGGHMNRHRQEREREQLAHARQLIMQQDLSSNFMMLRNNSSSLSSKMVLQHHLQRSSSDPSIRRNVRIDVPALSTGAPYTVLQPGPYMASATSSMPTWPTLGSVSLQTTGPIPTKSFSSMDGMLPLQMLQSRQVIGEIPFSNSMAVPAFQPNTAKCQTLDEWSPLEGSFTTQKGAQYQQQHDNPSMCMDRYSDASMPNEVQGMPHVLSEFPNVVVGSSTRAMPHGALSEAVLETNDYANMGMHSSQFDGLTWPMFGPSKPAPPATASSMSPATSHMSVLDCETIGNEESVSRTMQSAESRAALKWDLELPCTSREDDASVRSAKELGIDSATSSLHFVLDFAANASTPGRDGGEKFNSFDN